LEPIRARANDFGDYVWSLPREIELVKPYRVLDTVENHVADVEGAFLDVAIMVAANTLEVSGGLDECGAASFLEVVYVNPPDFFCGAFLILLDCGRLPHDVSR